MNKSNARNASPKTICISSGKGGVGKTSIAINLATALSKNSRKVLLIDGDLGLANVDVVLGLNVRHTIQETVEKGRDPLSLLIEIMPGFHVLPASSGVPEMANLSLEEQVFLTNTLEEIIDQFDYVLVDSAAGIGDAVLWFNDWSQGNIIILSPDPTSMTDAYALIKILHSRYGKKRFNLVINSVKSKKEGREVFEGIKAVLKRFLKIEPDFLGSLPVDNHVVKAIRNQKPFLITYPDSRASIAITEIADRI